MNRWSWVGKLNRRFVLWWVKGWNFDLSESCRNSTRRYSIMCRILLGSRIRARFLNTTIITATIQQLRNAACTKTPPPICPLSPQIDQIFKILLISNQEFAAPPDPLENRDTFCSFLASNLLQFFTSQPLVLTKGHVRTLFWIHRYAPDYYFWSNSKKRGGGVKK